MLAARFSFDGVEVKNWNAAKARSHGIETVHQSRALSEQQSIYANVFLGRELTNKLGFVQRKREIEETEKLIEENWLHI